MLPAGEGDFVERAAGGDVRAAVVVEAGRVAVGEGQRQRGVVDGAVAGGVEIRAGVAGGLGERPERVHGVAVVAERAFKPQAVIGDAAGDLRAEAAVGVVDGFADEFLVAGGVAGQADRAVLPALDVVDAHLVGPDGFGGGQQEAVLDLRAFGGGERVAHQRVAPGDGDQPDALIEGLRHDAAASDFFLVAGVVQPVAAVALGVGEQDLAGARRELRRGR